MKWKSSGYHLRQHASEANPHMKQRTPTLPCSSEN